VTLHIRRDPGVMIYVYMQEHCAFKKQFFFDVANFTTPALLSLRCSCKLSFLVFGLKTSSLHNFALKAPSRIFLRSIGNLYNTCANSSQKLSFELSILSQTVHADLAQ